MKTNYKIKELRIAKNISQTTLALKIGAVQSLIWNWENGKVDPSGSAIIKLAQFFNVSADYILGLTDEPTPKTKSKGEQSD